MIAAHFRPLVGINHDGQYARACRRLSIAVRALLPRYWFITSDVRSTLRDDDEDTATKETVNV